MAQTYLLTTPDGEEVHVETSQAGETITTPSGKAIEVPTLREMKKLPLVATEPPRMRRQWGIGQSVVLVIGLLITLIAGIYLAVFLLLFRAPFEEIKPELPPEYAEMIEGDVQTWDVPTMLDFWAFSTNPGALDELRTNGMQERGVIEMVQDWQVYRSMSIGVLIVGILIMLSAFFIPGTKVPA